MIRAVIGTVAVLAGFAVVENAGNASTGPAGACRPTQAYALLHPGEPLVVRSAPTPEAPVLGALSPPSTAGDTVASVVTLTGSQSGWARIALDSKDYVAADGRRHEYGWLPADLLAVDSRLDGPVTVYDRPGLLGSIVDRIAGGEEKFRVLGCSGELLRVINARRGNVWIDRWCATGRSCRG
jgi:hypothetical protein